MQVLAYISGRGPRYNKAMPYWDVFACLVTPATIAYFPAGTLLVLAAGASEKACGCLHHFACDHRSGSGTGAGAGQRTCCCMGGLQSWVA
jgi:hypothetical protein